MEKTFSVIVPIYKIREEYLRQCIESLVEQTFHNIEIHLMDDGSPDQCGLICDEYAKKDDRIVVHHLKNGGLSFARNTGIEASKGDWLIFLDGDDWLSTDFCDNMNKILTEHPNTDVLYTCYCQEYQNGKIDIINGSKEFQGVVELDSEKKRKLLMAALFLPQYLNADISTHAEYSIALWGKVFRREFLIENRLQCVRGISPFEDNIFCAQMLEANPRLYFDNHISVHYRINKQSVTQRRLDHEYEIRNLVNTLNALDKVVTDKYLMALFSIMRFRQVTENVFIDDKIRVEEKKNILEKMRKDPKIEYQLQRIQKGQYQQQFYKNHRLFYGLFSRRQWLVLDLLFSIKKISKERKKTDEGDLVRFQ